MQLWAAEVAEMLVNDGPYNGTAEGARQQCDDVRSTISEMIQKRTECPEAISEVRWQQMEVALQDRKHKLKNLQMEIDTFWDAVNKMDKALQNTEGQIGKFPLYHDQLKNCRNSGKNYLDGLKSFQKLKQRKIYF